MQRGRFWLCSRKNFATIADILTVREAIKEFPSWRPGAEGGLAETAAAGSWAPGGVILVLWGSMNPERGAT